MSIQARADKLRSCRECGHSIPPPAVTTRLGNPKRVRHERGVGGAVTEGHIHLSDLDAAVAHPLLQRARIDAADHDGAEGMAQIV